MAPGLLSSGKRPAALGIDLDGLDISGTVDAALLQSWLLKSLDPFSRFRTSAPQTSLMVQPSDDQTEPTDTTQPVDSTDDTGSTEAVDSTGHTDPAGDTAASEVETNRC